MIISLRLLCVLPLLFQHSSTFADKGLTNEIYESFDKHGNKRYSDKIPTSGAYLKKRPQQIQTIHWKQSNGKTYKTKKRMSTKKQQPNKKAIQKARCEQLESHIKKLDRQLRKRLAPDQFENTKIKLRQQRGHFRKFC